MLEVCCSDLESVCAAKEGGADRVELCVNLDEDGLTPPEQLIRDALNIGIRVHVLIRCRAGNFVYSEDELQQMENEIVLAKRIGAHGVVIGCLTKDGNIDVSATKRLIQKADGMSVTFHRAFDVCRDPYTAFRQIEELGCQRLLTSGQKPTAFDGVDLLKNLVALHSSVIVMAGSGVSPENAHYIMKVTGCKELHGTLRSVLANGKKQTTVENVRRTLQTMVI